MESTKNDAVAKLRDALMLLRQLRQRPSEGIVVLTTVRAGTLTENLYDVLERLVVLETMHTQVLAALAPTAKAKEV